MYQIEPSSNSNKACEISSSKADLKKYNWKYDDANLDVVSQGTVVHNRAWEYSMNDYYSLVKVLVQGVISKIT